MSGDVTPTSLAGFMIDMSDHLGCRTAELDPLVAFGDLGIDSIQMVEVYEYVATLGIELPQELWSQIETFAELWEWVLVRLTSNQD